MVCEDLGSAENLQDFPEREADRGSGGSVVLDFTCNIIKVRHVCRNQPRHLVELPMPKWVLERVAEGGDVKFAKIGIRRGEPHLVLVAEREVQPIRPSEYALVVDINSWKHGIVWALIKADKVVKWTRERPDLGYIERMHGEVAKFEREYGVFRRLDLHETPEGRKLWQEVKRKKRKLHAYLRDFTQKTASRLAKEATRHHAKVVIDDMFDESRRELLEERISGGLAKIYLSGVRRFVKLFVNELRWYGIPYEFKRLYSAVCPKCGAGMRELLGRTMKCENCNLSVHRDFVPVMQYLSHARL